MYLAIAAIALVAAPRVSHAQIPGLVKPFQLGIAGGAAQPMSDLKTSNDMGYNGTVALAFNLPLIPIGLRVDGAYNQFGQKANGPKLRMMSATGNVVWRLPSIAISPYLIGGAGIYRQTSDVAAVGPIPASSLTDNHFGWNAGAGVSLPLTGFKTFVEARYNRVSAANGKYAEFVPITFGIMF